MGQFILLPATGKPADAPVFATALAAARLLAGHLAFLHVRPDVQQEIALLAATDFGMGTGIERVITDLEAEADAHEHAAAQGWRDFCRQASLAPGDAPGPAGITVEWLHEVGRPAAWIAEHGRTADLVVTGRFRDDGVIGLDVMESALMETGRPVLIAPESMPDPLVDLVAIAWKNTAEAASAVAAARPFLRQARRVVVFTVEEPGGQPDESPRRLVRNLLWQNPNTSLACLRRGERQPVDALWEAVTRAGASLLVMGGYGHARLREAMFGGFTRAVLEQAPIPVLMAH